MGEEMGSTQPTKLCQIKAFHVAPRPNTSSNFRFNPPKTIAVLLSLKKKLWNNYVPTLGSSDKCKSNPRP